LRVEILIARGNERFKIVVLAAVRMARVTTVGCRTLMPLIGRRGQERTVRYTKSAYNASHLFLPFKCETTE
jgi:hypothetical protein